MIYTDFDHQKKILITRFEGDIYVKDVVDYIDATRLNSKYPRELRILTDSRLSKMLVKPEELSLIVEANNESLKEYTYIIDAIILENPHDTAMSYLYQEISKQHNYFFKLFSSFNSANKWLITHKPTIQK